MTTEILDPEASEQLAGQAIAPIDKTKLNTYYKTWMDIAGAVAARLDNVVMSSAGQQQWLFDRIHDAEKAVKEIEEDRTLVTKPLLEEKKRLDALYKEAAQPAQAVSDYLRKKASEGALAAANERKAALVAVSEAQSGAECQAALAAIPEELKTSGGGVKMKYTFQLDDLSIVPLQFLQLDERALRDVCKQLDKGDMVDVPGICFFQEPVARLSRKA